MERLATPSAGEEVEQLELVCVHAGGMWNGNRFGKKSESFLQS